MSNHLGEIYAITKDSEKYIVLNSQVVELSGNVDILGDLNVNAGHGVLTGGANHTITSHGGNQDQFNNVFRANGNIRAAAFVPDATSDGASVWWTNISQAAIGAIDGVLGGGLSFWANNGAEWIKGIELGSSGLLTKPHGIVAFIANLDDGITYSSGWNDIIYDNSFTQRGSSYNSTLGIFTAPVDGWYQFNAQATFYNNADTDGSIAFCINDSTSDLLASVSQADTGNTSVEGRALSGCGYLQANQNVRVKCYFSVSGVISRGAEQFAGWFSGFLIG